MKVVGFCGYSGSGKTTLVEAVIARLRLAGQRVSVVKHAHHAFDIDHRGKDSWRHRHAGAFEVVVASDRRLAKIREYDVPADPTVHQLLAELRECDWALVEGFKHGDLLKLEVWRADVNKPVQYPEDPFVFAIATDSAASLPVPTGLPVLDLNDPDAVVAHLIETGARYEYHPPPVAQAPADALAGRGPGEAHGGRRAAAAD